MRPCWKPKSLPQGKGLMMRWKGKLRCGAGRLRRISLPWAVGFFKNYQKFLIINAIILIVIINHHCHCHHHAYLLILIVLAIFIILMHNPCICDPRSSRGADSWGRIEVVPFWPMIVRKPLRLALPIQLQTKNEENMHFQEVLRQFLLPIAKIVQMKLSFIQFHF